MKENAKYQKKILIVDPQVGMYDPVVHALTANDYQVSSVDSIEKAWEALNSSRPDLILLETMVPEGTEGFHLVWSLRQHPDRQLSKTPVVIVSDIHQTTSLNLFPDLEDGHYRAPEFLPVQGFLDKPVDHAMLLKTVAGVF